MNGNNTKNHEIPLYPALQIKFNTQVQNNIQIALIIIIKIVLGTLEL